MRRLIGLLLCLAAPVLARRDATFCGTNAETPKERLFLHRQAARARKGLQPRAVAAASRNRDIGNIAIIEDADGIVARQNEFNLDGKTVRFTPSAAGYRYSVLDGGYDAPAAAAGDPVVALDDDDSRPVTLPFAFPFYGASYRDLHLNSDGNLTFNASDTASSERSLGRTTAGPPRISPLFDDVNPAETAGGVRVLSELGRVVVSWVAVPEWTSAGNGARQTFQARLYPDGRIEFSYAGVNPGSAVVGIAPGGLKGSTAIVSYRNDESAAYTGAVAERFNTSLDIDIVTLAQRFYETHEDAYDYLVVYNDLSISAGNGVIAYENTVRSHGVGYGVEARDDGAQYGSPSRLQAILNMARLTQYPKDPNALVPGRASSGDTPLTVLGHEMGHLFLAYSTVSDPDDSANQPMLGRDAQHWGFLFNSEASLLEGTRILDRASSASPRFLTVATAEGFSPLDQYLMGWRAVSEVPDTFYVTGAAAQQYRNLQPLRGIAFNGERRDVSAAEVSQAMGRRTPDHTIAQRHYRFAFILVTSAGANPSAADVAQVEQYRQLFEPFFERASSGRAIADTTLRRSLKLSLYPAAGVVAGATATATLTVANPTANALNVAIASSGAAAKFPASVTIPAGATTVSFQYSGTAPGVDEVRATPLDSAYETAYARVQVAGAAELQLVEVSSDPVVARLTDANGLVYAGARIAASTSTGTVTPAVAVTDAQGLASFRWTPGSAASNRLQLSVESVPAVSLTLRAGPAVPAISAIVNAASYVSGVAAGAHHTVFGANLAGATVSLDGVPLPITSAGATQINFYVPASTPLGPAALAVTAPSGERITRTVEVVPVQPGIFAVRNAGDGYLEIYCTGLGPTRTGADGLQRTTATPVVFIGATPVQPLYSGLTPGIPGLYQVNVRVPDGVSGPQSVILSVNLVRSNTVTVP